MITNARPHHRHSYVSTYDIADCFPSTTPTMVRTALLAAGIPVSCVDDLVLLTTHRGQLPQGAPTSSALLSMVMKPVDEALTQLANRHGSRYTRYADDICISANNPVAFLEVEVERLLKKAGFQLKIGKTNHWRPGQRRVLTHIVLGTKLTVERAFQSAVERDIHLFATGRIGHEPEIIAHARGQIGWIAQVSPSIGRKLLAKFEAAATRRVN